jgi:hypothetical protein
LIANFCTDFGNGNEKIFIHLPLADFTCSGKHVWCGNNEPLVKEIADAMWGFWDDSGRKPKYMPCFHFRATRRPNAITAFFVTSASVRSAPSGDLFVNCQQRDGFYLCAIK